MRIEKDEFDAWKDHRITELVSSVLKAASEATRREQADNLLGQSQANPQQWASLQVNAAYWLGFCAAQDWLVQLKLSDIQDEEEVKTE
jgi:hypothetical protein